MVYLCICISVSFCTRLRELIKTCHLLCLMEKQCRLRNLVTFRMAMRGLNCVFEVLLILLLLLLMEIFDCIILQFLIAMLWTSWLVLFAAGIWFAHLGLCLWDRWGLGRNHRPGLHSGHWNVALLDSLILEIGWWWWLMYSAFSIYLFDRLFVFCTNFSNRTDHKVWIWFTRGSKAEHWRYIISRSWICNEVFIIVYGK